MAELVQIPSGTITLLFTDIEGSTQQWEAEPGPMAEALRRHDEIMRSAIETAGGYVFKTVGDSFCAAFVTAPAAVGTALTAQRALGAQAWATSQPIRVRMGLHTGTCEERDGDYFGPVVNRAARLEAVAHGGQVLLSGVTAELAADVAGTRLRDLGMHRLKDLGRPEQIFQLEADGLADSFPPPVTLDNPELPNNLPSLLSAFVGRDRELTEVRSLLASGRLVTLTGAGGSGKTRLALQAAAELIGVAADGVWLAELAPISDGAQIPDVLATVLGIPDSRRSLPNAVAEALAGQQALIVLDNCEHVIDAAAKFCDQVIRHCPRVRILTTSREPLGIDGERVYRVPSMSLPSAGAEAAEDMAASDAVALFTERSRLYDPGFALDDADAQLVAVVCRRLDGIPLALELAAARLSSMSLGQIAARLDQRFRLLTGGSRNALPRQQTLQATVDWSFGLLTVAERETLTRLSVFAGGFDLEAAEAVCAGDDVDSFDVIDLVGSLVAKSLVVADHEHASVRYRLLETIRQYSAQELIRLAGEDGAMAARDRHAGYFLALAETAAPALTGREQASWLRRLDAEWDNLRTALEHLAADRRAEDVCRLCVALHRFAISRGHAELIDLLRQAIAQADQAPSQALVGALLVASWLIWMFMPKDPGSPASASGYAERALAMARELGDRPGEATALGQLALAEFYQRHDHDAVRRLTGDGIAIAREAGDLVLVAELLSLLAIVTPAIDERRRLYTEALACSQQVGDDLVAATVHHSLYGVDLRSGRLGDGQARLEQGIALAEELGARAILHFLLADLGLVLMIQGKSDEALPVIRRALLLTRRIGLALESCDLLLAAACAATAQGHPLRAARLHGAADTAITTAIEFNVFSWTEPERALQAADQGELRRLIGDQVFDSQFRAGTGLSRPEAIDLALSRAEIADNDSRPNRDLPGSFSAGGTAAGPL